MRETRTYDHYYYDPYDPWNGYYEEEEETISEGILGVTFFTNVNIPTQSKTVPYLTVQYSITDLAPEGDADWGDVSSFSFGGGLRFFVVEKATINTTALYSMPLKDAKYKYKTLSVLLGISVIR